jgi:hypothetical protein
LPSWRARERVNGAMMIRCGNGQMVGSAARDECRSGSPRTMDCTSSQSSLIAPPRTAPQSPSLVCKSIARRRISSWGCRPSPRSMPSQLPEPEFQAGDVVRTCEPLAIPRAISASTGSSRTRQMPSGRTRRRAAPRPTCQTTSGTGSLATRGTGLSVCCDGSCARFLGERRGLD